MKILLKVNTQGEPYLSLINNMPSLQNSCQCLEAEILDNFIRKALTNGIEIRNESSFSTARNYATIRIKEVVK